MSKKNTEAKNEIPDGPADLPTPGEDDGFLIPVSGGGDSTFEGDFDEGVVGLTCVNLFQKKRPTYEDKNKVEDVLVFLFAIDGRERQGEVALYAKPSMHEKATLRKIAKAFKVNLEAGTRFGKSLFVGKQVKGVIEEKKSRDGERSFPKITQVLAA